MKKKRLVAISALALAVMLWGVPMTAEAFCLPWEEVLERKSYCATPVCYTGNRTYFTELNYKRLCISLDMIQYKMEKVDNGCCPYN